MRKLTAVSVALLIAAASTQAMAIDITNPFNHVTQPQLGAAVSAQSAINGQLSNAIGGVQNAAQIANEKADAGAIRADGIEASLANTDNRSINNAVRLDGVEAGVANVDAKLDGVVQAGNAAIGAINNRVDDVNGKAVNAQNTADFAVGAAQDAKGAAVNAQNTANYSVGVGQANSNQIATITDVNTAQQVQINTGAQINTRQDTQIGNLQSYAADMDQRLGGRLDSQQSQINSLKRDTKEAKEAAAGALAVAGQQFSTDKSAGFQTAISAATIGGKQAIAIGAGGAVTETVFINAAITKAGSTTGGVISGTYRFQ